jgi:GGDEF domain-containing protein
LVTKIEDDFRRSIRCQKFLYGCVRKHRHQCLCDLLANDAEEPVLSVSAGVACYPKDADTVGTLLFVADRALYAMQSRVCM